MWNGHHCSALNGMSEESNRRAFLGSGFSVQTFLGEINGLSSALFFFFPSLLFWVFPCAFNYLISHDLLLRLEPFYLVKR